MRRGTATNPRYVCDANGNRTKDLNQKITNITYNLLNLPQSITADDGVATETKYFTYAADGTKLQSSNGEHSMTYCGNFIYLTDHLGNNRVVANAGGTVVQTNHYYPYGMTFAEGSSPNLQPYKFGGKEKENWKNIGSFDFGARIYHPGLGEFGQGDPMMEKYYSVSPYGYCGGNPVNNVDLHGDTITTVINSTITNADGTSSIQSSRYYYGQDAQGKYGFIGTNGQMYSGDNAYVKTLTEALKTLQIGTTGKTLVGDLINSTKTVQIAQGTNNADPRGAYVHWNPNLIKGGMNTSGNEIRPAYIGLGHELGHIQDTWKGTIDASPWVTLENEKVIPNSEKYATHVENMLRSEHGIPLRTHYGITVNDGIRSGLNSTRIITQKGYSIFFKKNGKPYKY
jgi:RHS repeat-associated protein